MNPTTSQFRDLLAQQAGKIAPNAKRRFVTRTPKKKRKTADEIQEELRISSVKLAPWKQDGNKRLVAEFPYPPSDNQLYATFNNRRVLSLYGRLYKKFVADCMRRGVKMILGPVKVSINVYRPQRSGDLQNRFKACLDSLSEIAYRDDEQIVEFHAYRFESPDNPRVEVIVSSCSEPGGQAELY